MENYLMHHGIKGMRWGVRRYQNEDGTLTTEGKKRYGVNSVQEWKDTKKRYSKRASEIDTELKKKYRLNQLVEDARKEDFVNSKLKDSRYEKYQTQTANKKLLYTENRIEREVEQTLKKEFGTSYEALERYNTRAVQAAFLGAVAVYGAVVIGSVLSVSKDHK